MIFANSEQQHSAKITQELREVRIKEGLKAKYEASFAGNPKPEIIWQFNGVDIVDSTRIRIKVRDTKTTLTIHDVTAADAGQYTLRVKNDLGSDVTRAGLTISSKSFLPILLFPLTIGKRKRDSNSRHYLFEATSTAFNQNSMYPLYLFTFCGQIETIFSIFDRLKQ